MLKVEDSGVEGFGRLAFRKVGFRGSGFGRLGSRGLGFKV